MTSMFAACSLLGAVPLPPPDPLGYPLSPVIIQALAWFTLSLHFLAVNFTLGGLLLLLYVRLRRQDELRYARKFLSTALPLGFSYLVTLGIPPLLFVQVLYGQMFYSSSVVIGAWWILVIPLLIFVYGLLYLHKFKGDAKPGLLGVGLAAAALAMLTVGFIYVNNLTLSMTPDRWLALYAAHPAGSHLNLDEPTLVSRYLLFMSPTLAVGGLALLIAGGVFPTGAAAQKLGLRAYLLGRVFMAAAGAALIATLPPVIRDRLFAGGQLTAHFGAGLVLALVATALAVVAYKKKSTRLGILSAVVMLLEVASFVGLRDLVRLVYLRDYFTLSDVPVHEQWGMFVIFVASMVAGLALIIVLTVKVSKSALAAARAAA